MFPTYGVMVAQKMESVFMYVFGKNLNEWFTEHCLICSSVNHIFLDHPSADAWECWNCMSRWWIDDAANHAYVLVHGVSYEEADKRLKEGNLVILNGQNQQW